VKLAQRGCVPLSRKREITSDLGIVFDGLVEWLVVPMKFAIISDTHFGDDTCALITKNVHTNNISPGPKYEAFKNAVGEKNDYLILAGDIFDFSIAPYAKAYEYGKVFFKLIKQNNIANEIIYIPGNHDADIWHIVQHQRSVINRLLRGDMPKQYEHSVAGIIDDREVSPNRGFWLNKVKVRTAAGKPKYGEMFLDFITGKDDPIAFNFAYPNLYIVTNSESVLVTHGQYLESYWSALGEFAVKIAYDDLKVGEVDIEEMVEMNFPLNQLSCTGLGQAGVLTDVVRQIQIDVKGNNLNRVHKYLNRLENVADEMTDYVWIKELVADYLLKKAKEEILSAIGGMEKTRYSEEFLYKKEVKERFRNFYNASMLEIGAINETSPEDQYSNIPAPWRIILGHTHQPISWNEKNPPKLNTVSSSLPKRLTLHNTGGWLMNNGSFCGAEVFTYETGQGFSSVSIV